MESFLNRYRNITVLLLVIFAQLVLLAVQVKNDQDVRVIRLWTVTAVTPVARIVEWFRGGSVGFVRNYILLHDASAENRRLRDEVGKLRVENIFLHNELATADRAKALQVFQAHTPSKMLAANVIGAGPGTGSKVVYVNRGSSAGVMRGMAVVTPDGIVGKVIAAYPTASQVQLITDPEFAAGVISQKSQVRGTLKGVDKPLCNVDYVAPQEKLEVGEWFYTSGDDRVFPRGFPVGVVKEVGPPAPGQIYKEVWVEPSGLQHGVEDVLILIEGAHQEIPDVVPGMQPVYIAPAPPSSASTAPAADPKPAGEAQPAPGTEADKLRQIYKSVGEAQNHNYGEGAPGSKPPDFTKLPNQPLPAGQQAPVAGGRGTAGSGTPAVRPPAPAGQPGATPVRPATPAQNPPPTGGRAGDAVRRGNQAAGAPGGPGRQ